MRRPAGVSWDCLSNAPIIKRVFKAEQTSDDNQKKEVKTEIDAFTGICVWGIHEIESHEILAKASQLQHARCETTP